MSSCKTGGNLSVKYKALLFAFACSENESKLKSGGQLITKGEV